MYLRDAKAPSGVALIFVGSKGENSIAVASGANGKLRPADVKRSRAAIECAQVLLMQLETPLDTIGAAARIATAAGVITILNPAPAHPLPAELLSNITILTPNETEAEMLTGIKVRGLDGAARAAQKLRKLGVSTTIITLGSRGAFLSSTGSKSWCPAAKLSRLIRPLREMFSMARLRWLWRKAGQCAKRSALRMPPRQYRSRGWERSLRLLGERKLSACCRAKKASRCRQ